MQGMSGNKDKFFPRYLPDMPCKKKFYMPLGDGTLVSSQERRVAVVLRINRG